MPSNVYEVLSLAMRYWFVLLGLVIVLRSFSWLRHDRKEKHRRLRELPDAGNVGAFFVCSDTPEQGNMVEYPVTWEGVLGSSRASDLYIPAEGIAPRHCDYEFRRNDGLLVIPRKHHSITVDGAVIMTRKEALLHPIRHDSILQIGSVSLRFRAFRGLGVQRHAAFADTAPVPMSEAEVLPEGTASMPVYPVGTDAAVAMTQPQENAAGNPVWDTWFVDTQPAPVGSCPEYRGTPENMSSAPVPCPYSQQVQAPRQLSEEELRKLYGRPQTTGMSPTADAGALQAYRHRRRVREEAQHGSDEA